MQCNLIEILTTLKREIVLCFVVYKGLTLIETNKEVDNVTLLDKQDQELYGRSAVTHQAVDMY